MRIAIIAIGSEGDVRPFTALGSGFRHAGHEVVLVTHATYERLARSSGLDFAEVSGNPLEIIRGGAGQAWLESTTSSGLFIRRLFELARSIIDDLTRDMIAGARGSEALVYSLPLSIMGVTVAEALGIPSIPASLYPLHPSRAFPSILAPSLPIRVGPTNYASAALIARIFWFFFRSYQNRLRREELDLRPLGLSLPLRDAARGRALHLNGYSPSVVPRPHDWPETLEPCGYWFLDAPEWQPPSELQAFLDAGEPPLYVGFGSMPDGDASRVTLSVLDALKRTGRRAILALGWGGLDAAGLPDWVYPIRFVPHDWLFPRVEAAIYHGGAGTTAVALRSGIPSIIAPVFADQFYWGKLVYDRGLGAKPIPRKRLSAELLARALDAVVGNSSMHARCREMAARISAEDGVGTAVRKAEGYLRSMSLRTIR